MVNLAIIVQHFLGPLTFLPTVRPEASMRLANLRPR